MTKKKNSFSEKWEKKQLALNLTAFTIILAAGTVIGYLVGNAIGQTPFCMSVGAGVGTMLGGIAAFLKPRRKQESTNDATKEEKSGNGSLTEDGKENGESYYQSPFPPF